MHGQNHFKLNTSFKILPIFDVIRHFNKSVKWQNVKFINGALMVNKHVDINFW